MPEKKCSDCVFYGWGHDGHTSHRWCEGKRLYYFEDAPFNKAEECKYYIQKDEDGWNRYREIVNEVKQKEKSVIQHFIQKDLDKAVKFFYYYMKDSYGFKKILKKMEYGFEE